MYSSIFLFRLDTSFVDCDGRLPPRKRNAGGRMATGPKKQQFYWGNRKEGDGLGGEVNCGTCTSSTPCGKACAAGWRTRRSLHWTKCSALIYMLLPARQEPGVECIRCSAPLACRFPLTCNRPRSVMSQLDALHRTRGISAHAHASPCHGADEYYQTRTCCGRAGWKRRGTCGKWLERLAALWCRSCLPTCLALTSGFRHSQRCTYSWAKRHVSTAAARGGGGRAAPCPDASTVKHWCLIRS
jgi:hypothetical protein